MIGAIILIFVIAILGAAFTTPLQNQVTSWSDNLTTNGQTTAAAVVSLIPLLFWVLLAEFRAVHPTGMPIRDYPGRGRDVLGIRARALSP
jgi:hypothetical protein